VSILVRPRLMIQIGKYYVPEALGRLCKASGQRVTDGVESPRTRAPAISPERRDFAADFPRFFAPAAAVYPGGADSRVDRPERASGIQSLNLD